MLKHLQQTLSQMWNVLGGLHALVGEQKLESLQCSLSCGWIWCRCQASKVCPASPWRGPFIWAGSAGVSPCIYLSTYAQHRLPPQSQHMTWGHINNACPPHPPLSPAAERSAFLVCPFLPLCHFQRLCFALELGIVMRTVSLSLITPQLQGVTLMETTHSKVPGEPGREGKAAVSAAPRPRLAHHWSL